MVWTLTAVVLSVVVFYVVLALGVLSGSAWVARGRD